MRDSILDGVGPFADFYGTIDLELPPVVARNHAVILLTDDFQEIVDWLSTDPLMIDF
ncbi:MAG: hypothetical protein PHS86_13845 [Syntrophaceae bacterium]|nr:hypothetical protein [Syntrophaceae bacterium]